MKRARTARPPIIALVMLGIAAAVSGAQTVTSSESREKKPMSAVPAQQGQALSRLAGTDKPTIVLVHGAFADGSAWQEVVPLLQLSGYRVIAVQNSLAMLAEDVATTKRVIDAAKYRDVFAGDLSTRQTRGMAAAQRPVHGAVLAQSLPIAAWRTIPSWYLVAQDDRAISPELERFYARRMNAKTSEIKSSHLPFISHPQKVAALIAEAASASPR